MSKLQKPGCPFCDRILVGSYESLFPIDVSRDHVVNFEPLNPVTEGHRLFVPTRHEEHREMGSWSRVGKLMSSAAAYASRTPRQDFNLIISKGPDATQTIPHLHVHYVPRNAGDGLHLPWTDQA